MSRVAVVGAGYVGLVTGACLSALGHHVICIDLRPDVVDQINRRKSPIHEAGLDQLLSGLSQDVFSATNDLATAVAEADVVILAVGTPSTETGIDLGPLTSATRQVGRNLVLGDHRPVVLVKSTVVPGTTQNVVLPILEEESGAAAGKEFGVVVNPEFLTEGRALRDFMEPDRIVVGALHSWEAEAAVALYEGLDPEAPRIATSLNTAEMIKYASNSLLATMISFSNELANLGVAIGDVDIVEVMHGIHTSRYLTNRLPGGIEVEAEIVRFLEAGCGFGGSCLPKDTTALIAHGEQYGVPMDLLRAVRSVNEGQPRRLIDTAIAKIGRLAGVKVGVLGLAFKPHTDDIRESPALSVINHLLSEKAHVIAHDPVAIPKAREHFADLEVEFCEDLAELIARVEVLFLVTRWDQYQALPELLAWLPDPPLVVDGRRMLSKKSVTRYAGIGLK